MCVLLLLALLTFLQNNLLQNLHLLLHLRDSTNERRLPIRSSHNKSRQLPIRRLFPQFATLA